MHLCLYHFFPAREARLQVYSSLSFARLSLGRIMDKLAITGKIWLKFAYRMLL